MEFNKENFEIEREDVYEIGKKTVVHLLSLVNGMEVIGTCTHPIIDLAKDRAKENAHKNRERLIERIKAKNQE